MNARNFVVFSFVLAGFVANAEQMIASNAKETKPKVSFKQVINRREGGFIVDTRNQKGQLVIVNAQNVIDENTVSRATDAFQKDSKIKIVTQNGLFDLSTANRIGEATVFVIDNKDLPQMMVAADDGWAFVNVAKLLSEKETFTKARVRKEIVRAAGLVLGAGDSYMYEMCLTGPIRGLNELDEIPSEQLPVDVVQRIGKSMAKIGITPSRLTTYRKACEQGWAPAPTNDYQKAVWDQIHTPPSDPLKITFDPKTDTK